MVQEKHETQKRGKKMKKFLTILLALIMVLTLFAGCGKDDSGPSQVPVDSKTSTQPTESPTDDEEEDDSE